MIDEPKTPKRLCEDCRFSYEPPSSYSLSCRINGGEHCSIANPRGQCTEFEPKRSILRDSPRAAGIVSVGLGAALVELLHWIGGLL